MYWPEWGTQQPVWRCESVRPCSGRKRWFPALGAAGQTPRLGAGSPCSGLRWGPRCSASAVQPLQPATPAPRVKHPKSSTFIMEYVDNELNQIYLVYCHIWQKKKQQITTLTKLKLANVFVLKTTETTNQVWKWLPIHFHSTNQINQHFLIYITWHTQNRNKVV